MDDTDLAIPTPGQGQFTITVSCLDNGRHLWSFIRTEQRSFGEGGLRFKAPVNIFFCQWCLKHTRASAVVE